MSKAGTSKLVLGGRRALVALGLKRRTATMPIGAAFAGLAIAVGAVFAFPFARKAWALLALRVKPPSDAPSLGEGANGAHPATNGVPAIVMAGHETDELGRAENEGMAPGRS